MKTVTSALRTISKNATLTSTRRPPWSADLVALLRDAPSKVRGHLERAAKRSVLASGMREAEADALMTELRDEADRG
jgi:hypothetical protein